MTRDNIPSVLEELREMPLRQAIIGGICASQPGWVESNCTDPLEPDTVIAIKAVCRAWLDKDADNGDG